MADLQVIVYDDTEFRFDYVFSQKMPRGPASSPASLCILRLSAIGDCCHVLPLLRTLQRAWPETKITWVIGKTEHMLMDGMQNVEFITFDKRQGLRGLLEVRQRLAGRDFPLLLNLHASMRANLVSAVIPARRRIGFDRARARDYQWLFSNERIPAAQRQHVCDGMLGFAHYLGITEEVIDWGIPLADADREFARAMTAHDGPICVISPCSSQRARNFRNWSIDNYIAVVRHLNDRHNARVIVTGANTPLESEYADAIAASAGNVTSLMGRTTLKQLAALLGAADAVLAPDSGPVHMATAMGTPVIGLYATSNPGRTGPFRDPLELTVNRYPDAVEAEFGKTVDEVRWGQRVRNPDAMSLITVAEVTAKLDRVLDA